jgi:lathosterol oxidase
MAAARPLALVFAAFAACAAIAWAGHAELLPPSVLLGTRSQAPAAANGWRTLFSSGLGSKDRQTRLAELRRENEWKNDLVMWMLPDSARAAMPHAVQVSQRFVTLPSPCMSRRLSSANNCV